MYKSWLDFYPKTYKRDSFGTIGKYEFGPDIFIFVNFLRCYNGIVVMKDNDLIFRRCMLNYSEIKCLDLCQLLPNGSYISYIHQHTFHIYIYTYIGTDRWLGFHIAFFQLFCMSEIFHLKKTRKKQFKKIPNQQNIILMILLSSSQSKMQNNI